MWWEGVLCVAVVYTTTCTTGALVSAEIHTSMAVLLCNTATPPLQATLHSVCASKRIFRGDWYAAWQVCSVLIDV